MALLLAAARICARRRRDQLHVPRPRRRCALSKGCEMRIAAALLPLAFAAAPALAANATTAPYGVLKDGRKVDQVTLTNDRGMVVKIINYGAIVTDMIVPDAQGR